MATTTSTPTTVTTWNIDPAHSSAEFKVKHMMISNVKGRFNGITGKLVLDESDPTRSTIEAAIRRGHPQHSTTISATHISRAPTSSTPSNFRLLPSSPFRSGSPVPASMKLPASSLSTASLKWSHSLSKARRLPARIPGATRASASPPPQRSTARNSGSAGMQPSKPAASWSAKTLPSPSTSSSSRPKRSGQ